MKTIYEIWVLFSVAIAAVLRPKAFLDLPLDRRLLASSNALERIL